MENKLIVLGSQAYFVPEEVLEQLRQKNYTKQRMDAWANYEDLRDYCKSIPTMEGVTKVGYVEFETWDC